MIYFVPWWLYPFMLMAEAFIWMTKLVLYAFWLILLAAAWTVRVLVAGARSLIESRFSHDPAPRISTRYGECPECGEPNGFGHKGTCSRSMMRGGSSRDPSEEPTLELWPGERR